MGKFSTYEPTIGLEVHIQLATESKIFCGDKNSYGSDPNTNISVISLAHPGTLPRLNKRAVEFAIQMGLACHCNIAGQMYFDRKNYFYPDLPKGYQLTQDKTPVCQEGHISIVDQDGVTKKISLTKIHLEEDAGKLIHDEVGDQSQVDFNRAGVPLIELVTDPVIKCAEDAAILLMEIRKLVRFLRISTGDMEKGSLRCDANVSVAPSGSETLGKKVEIKNMNSFKHVKQAISREIDRQTDLLESGKEIVSETRLYDPESGDTFGMRTKEELNDYRYFPEPDLCSYVISDEWLKQIKETMPALPGDLSAKFVEVYGVSEKNATILTESRELARFFDDLSGEVNDPKAAANWLIGPVKSHLNNEGLEIDETTLSVCQLAELINLVSANAISFSKASSELLPLIFGDKNAKAGDLAKELDLLISSEPHDLKPLIRTILDKHPEKVIAYQKGKKGLLGMFMGEVMKETRGKIDPKVANELLTRELEEA